MQSDKLGKSLAGLDVEIPQETLVENFPPRKPVNELFGKAAVYPAAALRVRLAGVGIERRGFRPSLSPNPALIPRVVRGARVEGAAAG